MDNPEIGIFGKFFPNIQECFTNLSIIKILIY